MKNISIFRIFLFLSFIILIFLNVVFFLGFYYTNNDLAEYKHKFGYNIHEEEEVVPTSNVIFEGCLLYTENIRKSDTSILMDQVALKKICPNNSEHYLLDAGMIDGFSVSVSENDEYIAYIERVSGENNHKILNIISNNQIIFSESIKSPDQEVEKELLETVVTLSGLYFNDDSSKLRFFSDSWIYEVDLGSLEMKMRKMIKDEFGVYTILDITDDQVILSSENALSRESLGIYTYDYNDPLEDYMELDISSLEGYKIENILIVQDNKMLAEFSKSEMRFLIEFDIETLEYNILSESTEPEPFDERDTINNAYYLKKLNKELIISVSNDMKTYSYEDGQLVELYDQVNLEKYGTAFVGRENGVLHFVREGLGEEDYANRYFYSVNEGSSDSPVQYEKVFGNSILVGEEQIKAMRFRYLGIVD